MTKKQDNNDQKSNDYFSGSSGGVSPFQKDVLGDVFRSLFENSLKTSKNPSQKSDQHPDQHPGQRSGQKYGWFQTDCKAVFP